MRRALTGKDAKAAAELLPKTFSVIDRSAKSGIIKKNTAARYKSNLNLKVKALRRKPRWRWHPGRRKRAKRALTLRHQLQDKLLHHDAVVRAARRAGRGRPRRSAAWRAPVAPC